MSNHRLTSHLSAWKYPSILLFGIGLSNVGAWIYFIALNLVVLHTTQSPLALSILYVIRPIAGLISNVWAGSLVDRINKKKTMIVLDFLRAILLCTLLFSDSLMLIYSVTFVVQLTSFIFGHTSFIYMTKLIPEHQRARFNALNSLLSSGAFIIGPAIAGILLMLGTPTLAIAINIIILIVSGLLTLLMPQVENYNYMKQANTSLFSLHMIKQDLLVVTRYYSFNKIVLILCLTFGALMVVMASSVDSLEASFAKYVLMLSDADYGLLVSIAGVGMAVGALLNVFIVKRLSTPVLIAVGALGNVIGYGVYAVSHSFIVAATGFFVLCFFLSFANTGFMTYYQKEIPIDIMGRVGAFNGFIESVFIIAITTLFGLIANNDAIRPVVISGVLVMFILSMVIAILCIKYLPKTKEKNAITE